MRNYRRFVALLLLLVAAVPLLLGCGRDGPPRAVVYGSASYQGEPIKLGTIRFQPEPNSPVPPSGGYIVDGRYEITHHGGVPVGTHRVEVEGLRPKNIGTDVDLPNPPQEQYLPEKYNRKSDLTLVVTGDGKRQEFNLELE